MYAVTVEPLNTIFFVSDRPEPGPWPVEEGVGLDYAPNIPWWRRGGRMPEQVVCASTTNPKYYKVFRYLMEVDTNEFSPTGRSFGGIFAKETWDRFAVKLAESLAAEDAPGDDPTAELVRGVMRPAKRR
ncbi:MAG TPA: hypothetical protein VG406_12875 [Isosphaeraceae bacterium]|jgi:hypothetical protein|nr:hypothetical protein [Isosphaeraceae bacterium]